MKANLEEIFIELTNPESAEETEEDGPDDNISWQEVLPEKAEPEEKTPGLPEAEAEENASGPEETEQEGYDTAETGEEETK